MNKWGPVSLLWPAGCLRVTTAFETWAAVGVCLAHLAFILAVGGVGLGNQVEVEIL